MNRINRSVFACSYAKRLKINYKNGKSWKVKHASIITVTQDVRGGHNIEYYTSCDYSIVSDEHVLRTPIDRYYTTSNDVVSIEVDGAQINGMNFDHVKQVFKK